MNDQLQNKILEWMIGGLITVLVAAVAFAAKRWFSHVESLQTSIEKLQAAIMGLSDKFVTQAQYERDLRLMHQSLGRRSTDPLNPPSGEKVLLTDSGAKVLGDILDKAKKGAQ